MRIQTDPAPLTLHGTKTVLTSQTDFSRIKAFQIVEHISVGQKDPSPGPLGREPAGDGAPSTMLVKAHVTMPADTTTFLGVCLVAQWCPALCNPVNCSLPGSSVNRILQARILKWIALSFFKGIFPTQGLNPHLLHWQPDSLPRCHQFSCDSI